MSEQPSQTPEAPEMIVEHLSRKEIEYKFVELSKFRSVLAMNDKFVDFIGELESRYGANIVRRCELFHFVSGSGLMPGYAEKETFFDFTGDDSIEKYLRDNFSEK